MALFTVEFQAATNADWEDNFEVTDAAGDPIDLTGAAFEMDIRRADGTQLIELTTAAGTLPILNAAQGVFGVKVLAATMVTLAPGTYQLDCLVAQSGQTLRLFEGRLFLEKGITQ
jgi:hypothetical protein